MELDLVLEKYRTYRSEIFTVFMARADSFLVKSVHWLSHKKIPKFYISLASF